MTDRTKIKFMLGLFAVNQAVWLYVMNGSYKDFKEMTKLLDKAHERENRWTQIYDSVSEIAHVALKYADREAVGTELKFNDQFKEIVAEIEREEEK